MSEYEAYTIFFYNLILHTYLFFMHASKVCSSHKSLLKINWKLNWHIFQNYDAPFVASAVSTIFMCQNDKHFYHFDIRDRK